MYVGNTEPNQFTVQIGYQWMATSKYKMYINRAGGAAIHW